MIGVYEQPGGGVVAQVETHIYGGSGLGIVTSRTIRPTHITLAVGYGKPYLVLLPVAKSFLN